MVQLLGGCGYSRITRAHEVRRLVTARAAGSSSVSSASSSHIDQRTSEVLVTARELEQASLC